MDPNQNLTQRIKTWRMEQAHRRIVYGLTKCRQLKLNVPEDPPVFEELEDIEAFKKSCMNLPLKEIGTLCYLNDICEAEMLRIEYQY